MLDKCGFGNAHQVIRIVGLLRPHHRVAPLGDGKKRQRANRGESLISREIATFAGVDLSDDGGLPIIPDGLPNFQQFACCGIAAVSGNQQAGGQISAFSAFSEADMDGILAGLKSDDIRRTNHCHGAKAKLFGDCFLQAAGSGDITQSRNAFTVRIHA